MNDYSPSYDAGRVVVSHILFGLAAAIFFVGCLFYFTSSPSPSPCTIYSTTESRA